MKRSVTITLAAAALLLLALFLIFGSGGRRAFSWKENYKWDSTQPYGTKIIHDMLAGYTPGKSLDRITKNLPGDLPAEGGKGGDNYVFIGEAMYLDSADVQRLLRFVSDGNKAFISAKSIPHDLMFYLYYTECDYRPWDDYEVVQDTVSDMNFLHEDLNDSVDFEYKFLQKHKVRRYTWNYIDSTFFCYKDEGMFTQLGYFSTKDKQRYYPNFASVPYSDPNDFDAPGGHFYLHTNPLAFTNIQMVDEVGKAYAERVFSHLHGGDTYWDAYSSVRENVSRRRNQIIRNAPEMTISSETPLKYILGNKHLSWAWYSLVGMGILYIMFRAKRRQRIIPVHEPNTNTSLEFISTIGALYYNKKNHKRLCQQKMRIFLSFLRNRYHIATKRLDDATVQRLARVSGVQAEEFKNLFKYYQNINSSATVSDETLKNFHRMMEDIYGRCK